MPSGAELVPIVQGGITKRTDINSFALTPLAAPPGASLVGYQSAGASAVVSTVQKKLRERVSIYDFGAHSNNEPGYTTFDNAPAFNAAIAAAGPGGYHIMAEGNFGIASPIIWNKGLITIDGGSRVGSSIYALAADISTGAYPNALIVHTVLGGTNGTLCSMRFPNAGYSYTGWVWSSISGGTGGQQAAFSMHFHDLWPDMGTLAAGFITGGLYDSWAHDIQFENCKVRFNLNGSGVHNLVINNINELNCYDELVKTAPGASHITISNVNSDGLNRGCLFDFDTSKDFDISNIQITTANGTGTNPPGLLRLTSCSKINLTNFQVNMDAGSMIGIYATSSQLNASNGFIKDVDGYLLYPLYISGPSNDINFDNVSVLGGSSYRQLVTDVAGGRITFSNCTFDKAKGNLLTSFGANTCDLIFQNSKLLNSSQVTATIMLIYATSGTLKIVNCDIGRNDGTSLANYLLLMEGTGRFIYSGNNIVGSGSSGESHPTESQAKIILAHNVGSVWGFRQQAGTPVATVTPLFPGETFFQSTGVKWFKAHGMTNADWDILN